LEIINPLGDATSASNWRASFFVGGSPGSEGLAPTTSPGDFDANGAVDGRDFLAWQRGMGTTALKASVANGDGDYDRDVDGNDLTAWAGNFGQAMGSIAATAAEQSAAFIPWVLIDSSRQRSEQLRGISREMAVDEVFAVLIEPLEDVLVASAQSLSPRRRLDFERQVCAAAVDAATDGSLSVRLGLL
jgi:hypothetical protein